MRADFKSNKGQEPAGDNRADDPDHDVTDKAEAGALNDKASDLSSETADNKPDDKMHVTTSGES